MALWIALWKRNQPALASSSLPIVVDNVTLSFLGRGKKRKNSTRTTPSSNVTSKSPRFVLFRKESAIIFRVCEISSTASFIGKWRLVASRLVASRRVASVTWQRKPVS